MDLFTGETMLGEALHRLDTGFTCARHDPIYGYIYQVETGQLVEVPGASDIGRPR